MASSLAPSERINSYALVSYIPSPLGEFLDQMRRDLVLGCWARSHVTILPPRELHSTEVAVEKQLTMALKNFAPFRLNLEEIDVFADTAVIYLALGNGRDELRKIHDYLNCQDLSFPEPYQYHPHITLAQEFPAEDLANRLRKARQRWAEFSGPRSFDVTTLTFVQNTNVNRWQNLGDFPLGERVLSIGR